MTNFNKVKFIQDLVVGSLSEHERSLLIIELMVADGYDAGRVFTIIDDVLPFDQFGTLAKKLGKPG